MPAGSPSSSASTISCSTSATTSTTRRGSLRRRAHPWRDAEPVHRVQPFGEVRPARRTCRPARLRCGRHGPPRQHRSHLRRPLHPGTGRRSCQGPELRRPHARPGQLARTMFPVGGLQKSQVRELAASIDLRTADKPDSQDVCFITSTGGRTAFLGDRIPFRAGTVVDTDGDATRRGRVRRTGDGRPAQGARPPRRRTEAVRRRCRPAAAVVSSATTPTCCAANSSSTP